MDWRLNERRRFLFRRKRPWNGVRSRLLPCREGCESLTMMLPRAITESSDKENMVTSHVYEYEEFFIKF